MNQQDWVKDGTSETSPVTSSTPTEPAIQPATQAAESAGSPAVATDSSAGQPATSAGDAASKAQVAATVAGASPAEAAAAGKEAAEAFIEGRYQDKPFKIPAGVSIPWKRGNEQGFASIDEIRRAHMFEKDYRQKTAQVAEERRVALIEQRKSEARIQAQATWLEQQQQRQAQAFADPEEQAKFDAFLNQYRHDPAFKKMVDDSREAAALLAEHGAVQEIEQHEMLVAETSNVLQALDELAQKYPDVDADAVRMKYSEALIAERLPLSYEALESLFRQDSEARGRITAPILKEVEQLRAQVADLHKQKQTETHNTKTRTAIARAKSPVGAPSGGTPPAPVAPSTQLKGKGLAERSREWVSLAS